MVNGTHKKLLSKKHRNVKVFHFSGIRVEHINLYIIPIIKKQPDCLIIHVGTNYTRTNMSNKIVDSLLKLKSNIAKTISKLQNRIVKSDCPFDMMMDKRT